MSLSFDERDRDSVLGDLTSPDEEVRRLAVERISALPEAEAIACLVERLGDASWRVRKAAVERLVACPADAGVEPALVEALADGDNPGRRNAAVEALVRLGARAVPHVVAALSHDDPDVRKFAVDALAGLAELDSAEALVGRLADPDPNVRAAAADALGGIGGPGVAQALQASAFEESEDPLVRFSALRALDGLGVRVPAAEMAPLLEHPLLRTAGMPLLGGSEDPQAADLLLKALSGESRATREAAIRALLRLVARSDAGDVGALVARIREVVVAAPGICEDAIRRLAEADLPTRLVLLQFLGLVEAEGASVPILVACADEALREVGLSTLAALGERAEREIDAAWTALDARGRRDACVLFGRGRGERSTARLLAALGDPEPETRSAAAGSIGARRLAEGLDLLVGRLAEAAELDDFEGEEETDALCRALIAIAGDDAPADTTRLAVERLASCLDGAGDPVRQAVARVLGAIGRREDAELVAFLLKDPSPVVRRAAVEALPRLDAAAEEPLRFALADESAAVRMAAAAALCTSPSETAFDDLCRLAEDEDARVRAAALQALGAHLSQPAFADAGRERLAAGLGDAVPVALAALSALREAQRLEPAQVVALLERPEPELLQEAIRCLGAIGDATHLDALVPLASSADWSVRAEAIQVLGDRQRVSAAPALLRRLETEQDEFVREVILTTLRRLED